MKIELIIDYKDLTITVIDIINNTERIESRAKTVKELEVDLEVLKGAFWNEYIEYDEMIITRLNESYKKEVCDLK